ncbi:MAG: AAA family ATPase [Clostridium sp.]|nr:AAA family ATPase [Clostridium sp.]
MKYSIEVEEILEHMLTYAKANNHEFITAEHLLYSITFNQQFIDCFNVLNGDVDKLRKDLEGYFDENIERVEGIEPEASENLGIVLMQAGYQAVASECQEIKLTHIIKEILELEESYGAYYIFSQGIDKTSLIYELCEEEREVEMEFTTAKQEEHDDLWKKFVVCLNEEIDKYPPLIGREEELERTMQILCRKYKNNPIHVGEAGVGKTAITLGLAKLIEEGKVPNRLKNAKVFSVDIGDIISGTQYRGDFEKRFKSVLEGVCKYENPIIYIDEIHNIVGAGAIGESSYDASNMLKPYLTSGKIRFIGATTYDEFRKHISKNKSLLRRFQKIDINEPSVQESIEILNGLKKFYENYHNIKYAKGTIELAVTLSDKYINDRFLPDKAIDLIDEAGAYRVMHPLNKKIQTVDKKLIETVVSKTCCIPKETVESDEVKKLLKLEEKIKEKVFGQDEAVESVVNAVKLSRAGLNEENKPIASLLFVGPTGVGKTEVAKTLAQELNVELIRFDMSEYMEKQSVAKLIGSPAGYVGYEDGGLLTSAIQKNPNCVLLLDEIEKAHSDIYNILLQVMDYATLTDNQGRKADFRNVILIMTSNAGASKLNKNAIGFGERKFKNECIDDEVKKVFSPEFRNRLNKIVVFNNINKDMAIKIVNKEINNLEQKLIKKKITLKLSKKCIDYIINKGISEEYGAREIKRIIDKEIKNLLVDEILFGRLKKGGKCNIDFKEEILISKINMENL